MLKTKTMQSLSIFGFALVSTLALGGCQADSIFVQTKPEVAFNAGPKLAQVRLPNYIVGEAFTYDDGRTETVMAINGDRITWRSDQGIINVKSRNFLLPSLSWQTRTRRSKTKITGNPSAVWPLNVGKESRFNSIHIIGDNDGSGVRELSRSWQCVVEGTEKITVPLGTFNAYAIVCFRYGFETNYWRQTRKYYYAPEIGHYIARDDTYASRPSARRELVEAGFDSRTLPPSEQATLRKAFQETMTNNRDNTGRTWRSADGRIASVVTPLRTFKGVTGVTCRDYTSVYHLDQRKRSNTKRACKQADGQWLGVPISPPEE